LFTTVSELQQVTCQQLHLWMLVYSNKKVDFCQDSLLVKNLATLGGGTACRNRYYSTCIHGSLQFYCSFYHLWKLSHHP